MESFKNFIIDHIDRVLEYLKQNPLTIFVRRSVDAYMAAYALAAALGETTHVAVADWPPQRGVCVGFRCDGFYIAEGEAGVDDAKLAVEPTSLSHMVSLIILSLSPLERHVHKALYVGHYSWSVDVCERNCQVPKELAVGDERLAVVFPGLKRGVKRALSLSTLPIVPGVFGKAVEEDKRLEVMTRDEAISLLDWALGAVAAEGFHTAVLDKAVRPYSPTLNPADVAQRIEADLAGFVDKDVEDYALNLAEAFYNVVKRAREGVVTLRNPFYLHKIAPYLSYFAKSSQWAALRYETPSGSVVAVVPPHGLKGRLKAVAPLFAEVGQVFEFPTHLLLYVEAGRWGDFLKAYEKAKE
ncbi:hypothetical protein [Pyrobaculum calidifontis]|uniref:Uncharacterized protein n=1 Tax=Pyrobaculum calidifontis (strain DSM 21063 / JCM 11548 / VA1) TaxID=410359 RepID=A3MVD2_PYRCJ|nr:hypothetical protein [Pyrobaculum calidifontis]ABO08599.1 conserved hypothetical protein [Pyrobaculum calidifontis JCM 11548]